jgi:signal transduction histidine kinase
LEQIFERFYKSNQSITQEDTGNSGLGLTISKEIVEAHQGTVTVKSSLNRGSTFVVAIPLYQE